MVIHKFSRRDFIRDVPTPKRAALEGPVLIPERGRPAFEMLKIDDDYRIAGKAAPSLLEVMDAISGGDGIDFDPPKLGVRTQEASLD